MKVAVIALAIVVGILGGFYGGYKFGQTNVSASTSSSSGNRASSSGGSFTTNRGGFGAVCPTPGASPSPGSAGVARGTVTNLSSTSMTVSNTSCDVTVTFGPTTTVQKTVAGSTSDLADNQTVTIAGTRQADGSIAAQTIMIGTGGFGRGTGPTGSSPSGTGG